MTALLEVARALAPWLAGAALYGLRLLPSALLSPFLGGPAAPALVRLALAFGLGAAAQSARGAPLVLGGGLDLLAAAARELAIGVGLGLAAAFPVEAARAGGRLADTARGATLAELHVAPLRQRESALGDLLAQWTVALAGASGGARLVVAALLGSFEALPAGASLPGGLLDAGLAAASELLGCAVCLAAPAFAAVLAGDLALALAARAIPQLGPGSVGGPARAALGLAAVALAAGALAGRLTSEVALSAGLIRAAAGSRP